MSRLTGERIAYLRDEHNLKRPELAKILGVKPRTLAAYEQGTRDPSTKVLRAMVEYFNVTSDYILGYTNKPINLDEIRDQENTYVDLPTTIQVSDYKCKMVRDFIAFLAQQKDEQ
ncbi:helix-turn-helix domain-containing protein [uncultured Thomasclavelia sp.]|uniref:helix-turn-helix domain-containing protein n=1 Tax=uncultured Thomasclavelia sp. TaxID=3025759 RepID=UPI0025FCD39C|nr:helix-turn-helix transcriptional regulator [uncultured Thomasclavelia sp.]